MNKKMKEFKISMFPGRNGKFVVILKDLPGPNEELTSDNLRMIALYLIQAADNCDSLSDQSESFH